jgi:hypothetical protein
VIAHWVRSYRATDPLVGAHPVRDQGTMPATAPDHAKMPAYPGPASFLA